METYYKTLHVRHGKSIENQIRKKVKTKQHQDILLGILLGNDDGIEKEIKQNFIESNLSHILAVSGMHVAYITAITTYILTLLKIGKRKTKIITILLLTFFMLLTGNTPSVKRACIMAILSTIAVLIGTKSDNINNMGVSLLIILIQNPFYILNTGLILSYIATLGIILLSPKEQEKEIKPLQKIKQIMQVSISAWVAILPISIVLFRTISLTFIFSNILISFIIGIIIILGFIIIIPINIPILPIILEILLSLLTKITEIFSKIPISNILVNPPTYLVILIYYIILLFWIYIKKINGKTYKKRIEQKLLTNVDKFKHYVLKRKIQLIAIISVSIICYILVQKMPIDLKISFIDVGQGDCTLITTPNRKNILIDGGGSTNDSYDVGESVLLPYLLNHNIKQIDVMIISHFDTDHIRRIINYNAKATSTKNNNTKTI